jgi:predicted metal-dependent peptidase
MSAHDKMTAAMGTAVSRITAARTSLILDQPFFGSLALRLKLQADPTCKTAWVDGRTLGYSPAFVDTLSHDELLALVGHEVLHVALGHPWRRGARDHRKFNIAADKAINTLLRESGFTLPPDAYYAEGDEIGKSAEWIYDHMTDGDDEETQPEQDEEQEQEQDEEQDDDGQPGNDSGDGDGEQDGDGDGDADSDAEGDGKGQGPSESTDEQDGGTDGQGGGAGNSQGEVRDAPTSPDADGQPAPTEQEWKEAVSVAAKVANAQGNLPGSMGRAIAQALKPRVDVRSLLLRFMQERTAADYSWSRPNPRYMAQGTYLPALHSTQLGEVAIMVDTSGSIDDVALASARAIVQDVLDECNPAGVSLYFADTDVAHVERLDRGAPLAWEPKGGGGTDFRAALAAIESDESEPVCCICITDLEGTFPTVAPELPVIWLATKETSWSGQELIAPFGETVYIGE